MSNAKHWKPMRRATYLKPLTDAHVAEAATAMGASLEETRASLEGEDRWEYWLNDLYQVAVHPVADDMVHLNIRRRDGKPIFRDWRHFQWIKNEIVGEECEGFEIYPAESRLSDTSNKYHIFVFTDPKVRIPVGMTERDVIDDTGSKKGGFRQRKF